MTLHGKTDTNAFPLNGLGMCSSSSISTCSSYLFLFLVRDFAIGKQLFIVSGKLTVSQILSSSHLIHCFSVVPFHHFYNFSEGF